MLALVPRLCPSGPRADGVGRPRDLGYPALFARAADGHWSVGLPAPTPVLDTTGTRALGASMPALGGLF